MFKGDKYKQSGGDKSVNIQGENITYNGLSYGEAKNIAEDVFEANFYKLSKTAKEIAEARAKEITEKYLKRLENAENDVLKRVQDPDVQYALFTVQKEYARTGDENLGETLVELLVERTKVTERSLKQIVLNEAISVVPKLNKQQIDILTLLFVLTTFHDKTVTSYPRLVYAFFSYVEPFVPNGVPSTNHFLHLEYVGCISMNDIKSKRNDLIKIYEDKYRGLFQNGFETNEYKLIRELSKSQKERILGPCINNQTLHQIGALDKETMIRRLKDSKVSEDKYEQFIKIFLENTMDEDQIRKILINCYINFQYLEGVWTHSLFQFSDLTTVGIAIAHANLIKNTDIVAELEIFLAE